MYLLFLLWHSFWRGLGWLDIYTFQWGSCDAISIPSPAKQRNGIVNLSSPYPPKRQQNPSIICYVVYSIIKQNKQRGRWKNCFLWYHQTNMLNMLYYHIFACVSVLFSCFPFDFFSFFGFSFNWRQMFFPKSNIFGGWLYATVYKRSSGGGLKCNKAYVCNKCISYVNSLIFSIHLIAVSSLNFTENNNNPHFYS